MFQSGWWKIKIQPSATLIGVAREETSQPFWYHTRRTMLSVTLQYLVVTGQHWPSLICCSSTFVPLNLGSLAISMTGFGVFAEAGHFIWLKSQPSLVLSSGLLHKSLSPPQAAGKKRPLCGNNCLNWTRKMEILWLNMKSYYFTHFTNLLSTFPGVWGSQRWKAVSLTLMI